MIITSWRLVKSRYVQSAFSGEGPRRYGGRWNSKETPIVYTASTLSLAAMEILVNTLSASPSYLLHLFQAIPVRFDASLVDSDVEIPGDWDQKPIGLASRTFGDEWVKKNAALILEVPSVVVPIESNFLINPHHPDFSKITIGDPMGFQFDGRFLRRE
ncbi:MAG: RES family NAD+ phosphorylase [Thermodesulfobacteriota bacterium]|nr:RES family NAD+ phosphorylase [Thermodesulfobacteriota bacterium]